MKIIDSCSARARSLVIEHKEQIEKIANLLLEKETIDVLDIINSIGDRPFGVHESMKEYIREAKNRRLEEEKKLEEEKNKKEKDDNKQEGHNESETVVPRNENEPEGKSHGQIEKEYPSGLPREVIEEQNKSNRFPKKTGEKEIKENETILK